MQLRRRMKPGRGFTLIELLFAMTILGVVLGLIVLEFTAAIGNFQFENAHLDAETSARIAMAKFADVMRMGTPDVTEQTCIKSSANCSVLAYRLNVSGGNSAVSFYEVTDNIADPGHLSDTGMNLNLNGSGDPNPTYQIVTIYFDAVNNQLDECRIDFITGFTPAQACQGVTPLVLEHDITSFNVTPIGCPILLAQCQAETGTLQVDLTASNNTDQSKGSTSSGQTKENANLSNTLFFSSWKAFH